MAAGILQKPGNKLGHCENECQHRDCTETRKIAASNCTICGDPIGYERPFYNGDKPGTFDHAACLEDKIEAERKALAKAKEV